MSGIDASRYTHSPVHKAVLTRDYEGLRRIIASLPRLSDASQIRTEAVSVIEEDKADAIAAVIDRRDVPNRETPLHLAVKLADSISAEILMVAGADWSLQNEQGWSALQEAICNGEEAIAKIIIGHYQQLAWAKWCRRLPRVIGTMRRMRDFYMEISFHFESSVIPFLSRIAPSDTYKIWKRGSNLRADMTLAGFDGFRIQRSDQSILFVGDGSEDGKVLPGSLCMISHKDKEIMNALEGAGSPATEEEIEEEVSAMSKTNIFRPGVDVTQAVLLPQLTWRRQAKTEMVGSWEAKVYDMHHVVVSVKSRQVSGAITDDELITSCGENDTESDVNEDILTAEENKQLEDVLNVESVAVSNDSLPNVSIYSCSDLRDIPIENMSSCNNNEPKDRKGWFGNWGERSCAQKPEGQKKIAPPRSSLYVESKVDSLHEDSPSTSRKKDERKSLVNIHHHKESSLQSEYKKGLRPVLWLSPNFPLRTEELLPLLDIIANKVKAVRRLRELLTTKLPAGMFPVKVAIPVVPAIKVVVTFTKFEELQTTEEFSTPLTSPERMSPNLQTSSSWLQWIKLPYSQNYAVSSGTTGHVEDIQDPFILPPDYAWITPEKRKKSKNKSKKVKFQNQ